jgi:threonine/homoserine/homoserine lactone efflux protein
MEHLFAPSMARRVYAHKLALDMDPSLFFRSVLIGLAIAAPVGPVGVLCIRRSLAFGRASGFASGLGAATADALYGGIAAFGLTVVVDLIMGQRLTLQLFGGAFLIYLGLRTIMEKANSPAVIQDISYETGPHPTRHALNWRGLGHDYSSTFLLTLTNPMTILSFAAIFTGLGATTVRGGGILVVSGVFLGSALWWLALSLITGWLHGRLMGSDFILWTNRVAGGIVITYGILAIASVFWR